MAGPPTNVNGFNHRGVAYWTDGEDEHIYWGTGDGYLLCVDATSGEPCADFGEGGRVDLTEGLPRANRDRKDFRNRFRYWVTSPPIVVRFRRNNPGGSATIMSAYRYVSD